jgi:hypothetical protein
MKAEQPAARTVMPGASEVLVYIENDGLSTPTENGTLRVN